MLTFTTSRLTALSCLQMLRNRGLRSSMQSCLGHCHIRQRAGFTCRHRSGRDCPFPHLRIMNPQTRILRQVTIENAAQADRTFSMLMGDDVEPRKVFIEENAKYANIDA